MYGQGVAKGLWVTLSHFVATFTDDIRYAGRKYMRQDNFEVRQGLRSQGAFTVQYPDEKLAVPERFRFVPFLVTEDQDPARMGEDWCTSCGICAKVCPPQCIWIVRGTDPVTGRPKPEPEQFYIDIDVCMNCGYCAEYCPFDAIKMDHDYELASYDRTSNHIFDHQKLAKEQRYWETIAPTTAAEEMAARGGYDQTDVQKARKKQGLPASRPGPISEKVATEPTAEAATVVEAPESTAAAQPAASAGAATTTDGRVIVRRRGAGPTKKEGDEAAPTKPPASAAPKAAAAKPAAPRPAPAASAASPAAKASAPPKQEVAPQQTPSVPGGADGEVLPDGTIRRGPKRVVDPNNPPPVVRRRNPPPQH